MRNQDIVYIDGTLNDNVFHFDRNNYKTYDEFVKIKEEFIEVLYNFFQLRRNFFEI